MRTALATLLLALSALAGDALDRLVPDTTVVYVSLENLARTRERFQESRLCALWQDPAMQAFAAKAVQKWGDWIRKSREEEGWSLADVFEVIDGRVAVAITSMERGGDDAQGVLLAEVGKNGDKLRELIGRIEAAQGDELRRTEEEFRGATIVSYKGAEAEGADEDCWFLDGETFALASRPERLREVLARREAGEGGSLAEHEPYRRARARTGERTDFVLYVGCAAMFQAMRGEGGPLQDDEDWNVFSALGLADMEAACMQLAFEREGLGARLFVSAPGEKQGVLKLFDAPNRALVPPGFVGEDVTQVGTMALDIPALWEEVRRAGTKIDPTFGASIDAAVEMAKGAVGIDLQKDLIGALGAEVTWYMRAGGAGAASGFPGIPPLVLAIEVADTPKLDGVLQSLLAQAQGMVRTEDYLGVKLHEVLLPFPVAPAFALLPGQLVFAVQAEDVKDAIRRHGKDVKGLRDSADFARALEGVPEGRIFLSFSRDAKATRDSAFLPALGRMPGTRGLFDPALFPGEEVLGKYLDVSASAFVNAEDGILMVVSMRFKPAAEEDK